LGSISQTLLETSSLVLDWEAFLEVSQRVQRLPRAWAERGLLRPSWLSPEAEYSHCLRTIATSTGTTIVGLKYGGGDSGEEEGICLGADTRATGGPIVADKNCEKVSEDDCGQGSLVKHELKGSERWPCQTAGRLSGRETRNPPDGANT
jgi:hypothetical protein